MAFTSDKRSEARPDVEKWCDEHRRVGLRRGSKVRKGLKIIHFQTTNVKNDEPEFVIRCRACGHERTEVHETGQPELKRCGACGERHEYIVKA